MIKFGTGGWRAVIGDEFTRENMTKVAQGLAMLMKEEGKQTQGIVIGYDKRFLSDKSARWIAEVFAGNGISVNFIQRVAPTPLIMYSIKKMDTHYGLAVTASHNPAEYNGLKIFTKGGKDADVTVTDKIEAFANPLKEEDIKTMPFEEAVEMGVIRTINPFNDYIDAIIDLLDIESIRNKELRILIDPMFGVSKTALQTVLMTARCEVDVIHGSHDTSFGGRMPSPSEETLKHLQDLVVEKHYDLGIGTDGDADRLGIIDEKGQFIHPNQVMSLLYYYLLEYKGWRGPVVRNVATTHLLDQIAKEYEQECYEVPVGFKNISSKMIESGAVIGGESSGGLTIKGHIKGKDGIFAAALLVEMISKSGKRLGEMLDFFDEKYGRYRMVEDNLSYGISEKERLVKSLFEDKALPEFSEKIEKVSYLDGLKVYFANGDWLIARFSGTEPLIRIFAESSDEQTAMTYVRELKDFLGL